MKSKYDIKWHKELDSTNNEALRTADRLENMSVIAAEYQSSGRGQRGNAWKSDKGENLTFSILLRFQNDGPETNSGGLLPPVRAAGQFRISEAAAAAQCTLLERHGIPSEIKWPNDIYAGDRKISGMLVENSLSGSFLSTSVVGIGLNVNQLSFPPDLPNPTSMAVITGKKYDIRTLLEEFMEIFCVHIVMPDDRLRQIYLSRLYRMGREALFADLSGRPAYLPANALVNGHEDSDGKYFSGTICGVSSEGLLMVRLRDGSVKKFNFKEIAYVI